MHWLVNVARRAALPGAAALDTRAATPTLEAWGQVARACAIQPAELAARVAESFRLKVADLERAESRALKLLPEKVARRHLVFPLREDDRNIYVATADPADLEAEQAVGFASGRRTVFEVAPPAAIREAIDSRYSPNRAVESLLTGVGEQIADAVRVVEDDHGGSEAISAQEVDAAPVVKLTNLILQDAVVGGASDIHLEPASKGGVVRFRIDGVLRQHMTMPAAALSRIVSRIKILGKLDIADRLRPQDGRAKISVDNRTFDLRISTVPTREAEKAVIRVLAPDTSKRLEDVGLATRELARVRHLLSYREGIVCVTGPTGSGKTTTLYAAIRELATGMVNIMTVEDPVEYELSGITQIQVDPKRNVTFASALRAILRQDPDVIFVGEIRDAETAQIAVQAAMTGHLVLATLHTNDAVGAIARLVDLGIDRANLAATVRGAVAQRLVRRVCAACGVRIAGPLTDDEQRLSRAYGVQPVVRATGCARCGHTGYRGRFPVNEVVVSTPQLADQIAAGAPASALQRAATAAGTRPLREVALERVRAGDTTLQEVERVLGDTAEDPPTRPGLGPHILVVDDDAVERTLVSSLLQQNGFRVSQVDDGVQALELLGNGHDYAMLITDLHMPGLDGEGLLARVRRAVSTAGLPVVVLTGSDSLDTEVRLMEEGADDYIRKPIDPPRFVARIRATLRRATL